MRTKEFNISLPTEETVGFVRRDALPLSITKEFLAHQCLHRELTIDAIANATAIGT
jgi:hypothetical protein